MIKGHAAAQAAYDAMTDDYKLEEAEEEHSYCPDCRTVDGCSCDEQYEAMKDRQLEASHG